MKELSKNISYEFKDIRILEKAFYVRKMTDEEPGANSDNYCNSSMATVGDAVLKLLIADHLYSDSITKGTIIKKNPNWRAIGTSVQYQERLVWNIMHSMKSSSLMKLLPKEDFLILLIICICNPWCVQFTRFSRDCK